MVAEDKKPMPVDGSDSEPRMPDENGEVASRRDAHSAGGLPNVGESGGGAYPNPHSGKAGGKFEGGQSGGRAYYGNDQLGEKKADADDNSAASKDQ
jgi:hypothetical protein